MCAQCILFCVNGKAAVADCKVMMLVVGGGGKAGSSGGGDGGSQQSRVGS